MKQVAVFGSKISEDVIGGMLEDNLPVEVIKVETSRDHDYARRTESEIRDWAERELASYIGKVDVIVLCETEITLSAEAFLSKKYPEQKFVGYGKNLPRLLKKDHSVRVILSHATKRTARYQQIKSACTETEITESEYDPVERPRGPLQPDFIKRILGDFPNGLIVIYTPSLIFAKEQLKDYVRWHATVVDMRQSLFREACAALEFRGLDGRLLRDLEG